MKILTFVLFTMLTCLLTTHTANATDVTTQKILMSYQNDADLLRLEHLEYWTNLIEEYHDKTGSYPFQDKSPKDGKPLLVRILTPSQAKYMIKGGSHYNADLDMNPTGKNFNEASVKEFIAEIESKLGRIIDEHYDMQNVPTKSPVGYFYFATNDGYVFYTTCITCGVTPISTLLGDGYTPTVNIASEGMKDKVTKALLREEMLSNPIYKKWKMKPFFKEGYARAVEQKNLHLSKD